MPSSLVTSEKTGEHVRLWSRYVPCTYVRTYSNNTELATEAVNVAHKCDLVSSGSETSHVALSPLQMNHVPLSLCTLLHSMQPNTSGACALAHVLLYAKLTAVPAVI